MKKFKKFIEDRCKDAVAEIMGWSSIDTTDFVELVKFEERGFIMFGILIGIATLLYGLFNLTVLPICIAVYAVLDIFVVMIGVDALEMEEIERIDNEWKELEKEMENMKTMF